MLSWPKGSGTLSFLNLEIVVNRHSQWCVVVVIEELPVASAVVVGGRDRAPKAAPGSQQKMKKNSVTKEPGATDLVIQGESGHQLGSATRYPEVRVPV